MKVLQVNCVYNHGSTGKIVKDLHEEYLKRGIESVVCFGRGSDREILPDGVYKTCSEFYSKIQHFKADFSGVMYGGCALSTRTLIRRIEKEKPDIVHLHCINGHFVNIYRLLQFLKVHNIPTLLTLHAEFMYTGGCGYSLECTKWKKEPGCGKCSHYRSQTTSICFDRTRTMWKKMHLAFSGFDNLIVVSVSPWLQHRAEQSLILREKKHTTVLNGVNTSVFRLRSNSVRESLGIPAEKKIVFHATAGFTDDPSHMKGGYYVLQLAKKRSDLQFVIAGNYHLNDKLPENIKLLGEVKDQNKLAEFYAMADLTIITSQRETFSMVCAESLCCGTPVTGFKAGGPESISIQEYSKFSEPGDISSLLEMIDEMLNENWDNSLISRRASHIYSVDTMVHSYLTIYHDLIG